MKIIEKSRIDRKNVIILGVPIVYFLIMVLLSLYAWQNYGIIKPMDLLVYVLFASVLIERVTGKYEYEIDEHCFRVKKSRYCISDKHFLIPLDNVIGIYRYKSKLIGLIKFRHTYRLHSALDGRAVWTMAYTVENKKGRLENSRIYIKPSNELLEHLKARIPERIKNSEEEVAVQQMTQGGQ